MVGTGYWREGYVWFMEEIAALGDGLGKAALLLSFPDCLVVEVF